MRNQWQEEFYFLSISCNANVNLKKSGGVTTPFLKMNSPRALWLVNNQGVLGLFACIFLGSPPVRLLIAEEGPGPEKITSQEMCTPKTWKASTCTNTAPTSANNYFNAIYQGSPSGGYSQMVAHMLEDIIIQTLSCLRASYKI